jgi:predicted ATPase
VSIVGAGGIGKTRLAQALAVAAREHFAGGMWWVELSQLERQAQQCRRQSVRRSALAPGDDRPVLQTVSALLRHGRSLLVLDNCEQVLDAAADSVRALLADVPDLRVMVTSQEPLRLAAEHVYRLSGLASDSATETPAAVALFVARARAADPRLQPTGAQLVTIADICRRLDGMPLAIELAAARVDCSALMVCGRDSTSASTYDRWYAFGAAPPQTLRATLEWSHQLLSAKSGCFAGSACLSAASPLSWRRRSLPTNS